MLIGGVYFIFFGFLAGVLADILIWVSLIGSLDYNEWFMKVVTVVNNSFGLYVDRSPGESPSIAS